MTQLVVIADEAHHSQYDFINGFACHMRNVQPRARSHAWHRTPSASNLRYHSSWNINPSAKGTGLIHNRHPRTLGADRGSHPSSGSDDAPTLDPPSIQAAIGAAYAAMASEMKVFTFTMSISFLEKKMDTVPFSGQRMSRLG